MNLERQITDTESMIEQATKEIRDLYQGKGYYSYNSVQGQVKLRRLQAEEEELQKELKILKTKQLIS